MQTLNMKDCLSVSLICLSWLFFGMFSPINCVEPVHCQWGSYGDWSECDGCTKTQSRARAMVVYAQFGGSPCSGGATQTQPCVTARGCPLKEGCGGRFRCRSGKCISQSMVCNGDQDCEEDNQDELKCGPDKTFPVCNNDKPPPNVEQLGLGFDAVTGKQRGSVINTKSYGGQCRTVLSGDNKVIYRLPQSTLRYNFEVKVQNDFSDEFYTSSWSYAKDIVKRETTTGTTTGFNNYDLHQTEEKNRNNHLLVVKNNVEVAQFQNQAPGYLSLSEEFWKVLSTLPTVYDYATYRMVVERFGTHYLSEGTLGGYFQALLSIDQETATQMAKVTWKYNECTKTKHRILFVSWTTEKCRKDEKEYTLPNPPSISRSDTVKKVDVEGGATAHIAALKALDLNTPGRNWDMYKNWAESVRTFPAVIKRKMRPLYELVKEVQCAGMKRFHLKRAIEQYLNERHPCRCQPCRNNGLVVMAGDKCSCICKPGTDGLACEKGKEVEGQEGVIHGSWSCWSGWTSCSGGQRSRTRACSNPAPQRGGHHCNGEVRETTGCDDDQDLQYLQTMEPQCFDLTVPPKETCRSPPPLPNGYVLDPKDVYLVGSKIEYTCIEGYHLIGIRIAECTVALTWSTPSKECKSSRCHVPSLLNDVTGSPWQPTYDIGERIPLSCPKGRHIVGDKEIICDSSLHWSPDPNTITCSQAPKTLDHLDGPAGQCKPWEKLAKDKCICKMPYECTSSLQVCANNLENGRTNRLSVCKMHTLNCLGRSYNLAEDSACEWPTNTTSPCTDCQLWETCDGQTNQCRCKDWAECSDPGLSVCVRMGDDANSATQTLSECEAGLRRCKGEKVSVVSILPCSA
uniref:Complement component C7 n=1 Tax=Oncorhynchus mykiss TaxID=8022 RepID=A0A8C7TEE0_ONCMY